jgi:hypothetical protein
MNKQIISFLSFLACGFIGSISVITLSELTKFSHVNLIPFGGSSWAAWVNPLAIGISFGLSSKLFKMYKPILVFFIVLIVSIITFYFLFNGLLFVNLAPFGAR